MSTLQNSCQQKVLCRTLVAQDKVGLISASRREKSVTLRRRAFHTQHELHLSPRPARPHGISSGTPDARERRSGVPERLGAAQPAVLGSGVRGLADARLGDPSRTTVGGDDPRRREGSGPRLPAAPVGTRPGPSGAVVGRASVAG